MELAQTAKPMLYIRELASPALDNLERATGLHVQLAMLEDGDARIIDRRIGKQDLPIYYHIGDAMPPVPTAVGRLLLAFASPTVISDVLDDDAFIWPSFDSPRPTPQEIRDDLDAIRRTRLAVLTTPGAPVHSVAAPVTDRTKSVVAAVGVVVRTGTIPLQQLVPLVKATAKDISRRLAGPKPRRTLPPWEEASKARPSA
ncbi:IclR family transcriptional regulator domain-containing protein [Bifidobacterium simiarum]|uniref:IclR family transcriptional regulator domain-containing protein n=1 Tax=Bifidobacterium simiarum TaxID=2045441 RepID=UPI001BDD6A1F|nr:hypothetical protein [Bifidobacterium simiarum]